MDGKTARGSFDGMGKAVHLLSRVAQAEVPHGGADKTNEHKTALRSLEGLVLEGRLITGDAMFCQRDLSRVFVDIADEPEGRLFFLDFKAQMKASFGQIDLWMTTHLIKVL